MFGNSHLLWVPTSSVACEAVWVLTGFGFGISNVLNWGDGEAELSLVVQSLMDDHIEGFPFFNSTSPCTKTKL